MWSQLFVVIPWDLSLVTLFCIVGIVLQFPFLLSLCHVVSWSHWSTRSHIQKNWMLYDHQRFWDRHNLIINKTWLNQREFEVSQGISCQPNPPRLLVQSMKTNSMKVFLHVSSPHLPVYLSPYLPSSQILTTTTSEVSHRQVDGQSIHTVIYLSVWFWYSGLYYTWIRNIPQCGFDTLVSTMTELPFCVLYSKISGTVLCNTTSPMKLLALFLTCFLNTVRDIVLVYL